MYRVFGFTLASDYPFKNRLTILTGGGTTPADLTFTRVGAAPVELEDLEPSRVDPPIRRGDSSFRLHRLEGLDLLRFTGAADFYVGDDQIDCYLHDPSLEYLLEIYFLGSTLSFWLERRGIPAIHASAVDLEGRAIGFLSSNSGGKSSLAAALLRRGHALLTDDVLPVEESGGVFFGRPGYPQMRMWPSEAAHFLGHWEDLEIVHPAYSKRRVPVGAGGLGSFCGSSRPLACLYLPRRRPPGDRSREVEIEPVSRRDAVIELIRHSFSPLIVEALGRQAGRLDVLARLVGRVPVRRLLYPSGLEHLPPVCDQIMRDLDLDC